MFINNNNNLFRTRTYIIETNENKGINFLALKNNSEALPGSILSVESFLHYNDKVFNGIGYEITELFLYESKRIKI